MSGRLLARAALAMLTFCVLIAAWPLVETRFGALFRASMNAALSAVDVRPYRLEVVSAAGADSIDTIVRAEHTATRDRWGAALRSRTLGYLPLAVFASLLAATPIGARRRLSALLLGAALLQLYALARLALLLAYAATLHAEQCAYPHAAFLLEPWWRQGVHALLLSFHQEVMIPFATPVLVWLLVSFHGEDRTRGLAGSELRRDRLPQLVDALAGRR